MLGLAQSLVISRDLKASVAGDLDLHKEVFAQGISNLLAPFFSTFAGSGSFNRTSVAVEMGARTPLSDMIATRGSGVDCVGASAGLKDIWVLGLQACIALSQAGCGVLLMPARTQCAYRRNQSNYASLHFRRTRFRRETPRR